MANKCRYVLFAPCIQVLVSTPNHGRRTTRPGPKSRRSKKMTTSRRWRAALASAASTAILIAAPLIGAQAASAQPYPPSPPPLSVSTTTVTAGEELSFSTIPGLFEPVSLVTALLESKPVVLGRFRARADGSVAGTVTIPAKTTTGHHVFRLTSTHLHQSVGVRIYVLGSRTPTPKP